MQTTQNAKYRQEGHHLYKFVAEQNAFVHCYQDARYQTIGQLVKAYEAHCEEDFINGDSSAYDL